MPVRRKSVERAEHPPTEVWQALVMRLLRLSVQVAHRAHHTGADHLHDLLDVALVEELQSHGYNTQAMSRLMACTPRRVKRMQERAQELAQKGAGSGSLRRVIEALEQAPLPVDAIEPLLGQGGGFDLRALVIQLLVQQQVAVLDDAARVLTLVPGVRDRSRAAWERRLVELESRYALQLVLLGLLLEHPRTKAQLLSEARVDQAGEALLADALALMEARGAVRTRATGLQRSEQYVLTSACFVAAPEDPPSKLRMGLLDQLDKLALYLDAVLEAPGVRFSGQRNWLFKVCPEDLPVLAKEYRQLVYEKLSEMEARARKREDGVWAVMSYFVVPLSQKGS